MDDVDGVDGNGRGVKAMPLQQPILRRLVDRAEEVEGRATGLLTLFDEVSADGVVTADEHRRVSLALTGLSMRAGIVAQLGRLAEAVERALVTFWRTGHPPRDCASELDEMAEHCAYGRPAPEPVAVRVGQG